MPELDCKVHHAWVPNIRTGASRPEQVTDNFKPLRVIPKLTPAVLERIEGVLANKLEKEESWL
jgi:hypothetical protein